jgi:hypothetical protein
MKPTVQQNEVDGRPVQNSENMLPITMRAPQKDHYYRCNGRQFARGLYGNVTLDQHLDEIETETAGLNIAIDRETRALSTADRSAQLTSPEALPTQLRKRLKGPISDELKRRIVEVLVENVLADTVECRGVQQTKITVTYRFARPDKAAATVLPKSHYLTSRRRSPEKLETVATTFRDGGYC